MGLQGGHVLLSLYDDTHEVKIFSLTISVPETIVIKFCKKLKSRLIWYMSY